MPQEQAPAAPEPRHALPVERFVSASGLDPRLAALARRVAGADSDPMSAARRIQGLLLSQYAYSLDLAPGPEGDAKFRCQRKAPSGRKLTTPIPVGEVRPT